MWLPSPSFSSLDVAIVGAGPAGIGCAVALRQCGVNNLRVLDREEAGASFDRWPAQMRMITPSFHSNPYGQPDLNAITPHTSPADFLGTEHPTGPDYARYLRAVANHYGIEVQTGITVRDVKRKSQHFHLASDRGTIRARFTIWAAGEFSRPHDGGITGARHCQHNSRVRDWTALPGVEHAVIGGFESGVDAAIHLARAGKTVHVFSRGAPWQNDSSDPSLSLSPFTRDRLASVLQRAPDSVRFHPESEIAEVRPKGDGFLLLRKGKQPFEISTPPVLCTGFCGGLGPVEPYFTGEDGELAFTEDADESPLLPGLFYSGPLLRHRGSAFCYIYKFRGRFGVIASEIASRLGLSWSKALRPWQERGFFVEDLGCCTDCTCAVESEAETPGESVDEPEREMAHA